MSNHRDNANKQDELTKLASEMLAWGAAGATTGDAVAAGASAGAPLLSYVLTRTVKEFRERVLGHREAYRVATVAQLAKAKYEKNLSEGKQVRSDNFFLKDEAAGRSSADEIMEGTLLAGQREHEERKLPYYASLIANLPFEPAIDRYTANLLLRTAQELSYRQLCLLALVAKKDQHILPDAARLVDGASWEAWSAMQELEDLGFGNRELIGVRPQGGRLPTNLGAPAALEFWHGGRALYELMELADTPDSELYRLSSLLREGAGMGNVGD